MHYVNRCTALIHVFVINVSYNSFTLVAVNFTFILLHVCVYVVVCAVHDKASQPFAVFLGGCCSASLMQPAEAALLHC